MDRETSLAIINRVRAAREKQAAPDAGSEFANTLDRMNVQRLQSEAIGNVGKLGLAALGIGVSGRGAVSLFNVLRRNKERKTRSGPTELSLPVPVEAPPTMSMEAPVKLGSFSDWMMGSGASTKAGIPLYGPAMLAVGLGGLGAGWKGTDALLEARQKSETDGELVKARQDFHDALLRQYKRPLDSIHATEQKKAASDNTMEKVGQALNEVFGKLSAIIKKHSDAPTVQKQAIDFSNMSGAVAGGYGTYAGLSGLLTGAVVYDKVQKRSRRAILEKALQKRQRRRFMQSPNEIYATPTPIPMSAGAAEE